MLLNHYPPMTLEQAAVGKALEQKIAEIFLIFSEGFAVKRTSLLPRIVSLHVAPNGEFEGELELMKRAFHALMLDDLKGKPKESDGQEGDHIDEFVVDGWEILFSVSDSMVAATLINGQGV